MDQTFRAILAAAVEAGASDIHLKPGGPVMVRLDGSLIAAESPLPTEPWMRSVLHGLLPEHRRREFTDEKEIDFAFSEPELGRFRVNAYLQRGQPSMAIRLVKRQIRSFAELHLPDDLRRMATARRGIVVLGGATGSGKSTTLAAMVQHLNDTERRHIITLEEPIEFLFEDLQCIIEQREIGLDTQSFATGLRRVLRQDPDVVVIGEMRDAESARAAMAAANIGRLVFATLHTGDVVQSIMRVVEFFPAAEREFARQLLARTLHGVVCQRLVRALDGGMIPATEVFFNTPSAVRIIEGDEYEQMRGILEIGTGEGMHTFDQSLSRLLKAGRIAREEALASSAHPELMRMSMQGVVVNDGQRILSSRR